MMHLRSAVLLVLVLVLPWALQASVAASRSMEVAGLWSTT
jgi:hypothetical protein